MRYAAAVGRLLIEDVKLEACARVIASVLLRVEIDAVGVPREVGPEGVERWLDFGALERTDTLVLRVDLDAVGLPREVGPDREDR